MAGFSMMSRYLTAVACSISITSPALAWHEQGHRDVGAIADRLLADHPRAAAQVRAILHDITLEQAGPWGDCVREVRGPPQFRYGGNPRPASVCRGFADNSQLRRQMQHYVRNNWSQCPHTGRGCHTQYHFVNLAVQRDRYEDNVIGAPAHNLVNAIKASATALASPSCRRPQPSTGIVSGTGLFRFTCAQALMMLVHFVGDLHQPLHVGAVYLDENGSPVDPEQLPPDRVPETNTRGGNLLHFTESPNSGELHGYWDETPAQSFTSAELQSVGPTPGDPRRWPEAWANESLALASRALSPLRFSPKQNGQWVVRFANRPQYAQRMHVSQHSQIARGGVHLAQLLVAIWPD